MNSIASTAGLVRWLRDDALPFWATRGFDAAAGRFHERLDRSARPVAVPHRSMVQARQVFVFAEAGRLGWFPDGIDVALGAMRSLERDHADRADDRVAFRFADRGPDAARYDSYGHAFVLLAIASLHEVAPSPALVDTADGVLRTIDTVLTDPIHGGLFDAYPVTEITKRQNPLMHLFEALIALDVAMPGRGHGARAAVIADLFASRLRDPRTGAVGEHFARDWSRHPDPALAVLVEPGHLYEWAWLLDRFAMACGRAPSGEVPALLAVACAGVTGDGRIVDALAAHDLSVTAPTHRLWPHTEAVKAMIASGNAAAADGFAATLGRDFLDRPFVGGWVDRLDAAGCPLTDEVPASALYHLMLAGVAAARTQSPP